MSQSKHDVLNRLRIEDSQLIIAGRPAALAAETAGGTPCYVYDRQQLTARAKQLKQQLPAKIKLHYAIKANPMPAVVDHMATLVSGLDVASQQEMLVALSSGMQPENISFAGPAKSEQEIRAAIAAGITLNVESELEYERAINQGDDLGIKPNIAFRVNPDFELKASGMKMAGGPKQFGIDAEQLPLILNNFDNNKAVFKGFHIFAGSQNLKAEALVEAHTKTFALAAELAEHAPSPLTHLNIGGGLGIPYFPGETALDLNPVSSNLDKLLSELPSSLKNAEIVMELGRFLVGEAGYYICQVTDKKTSRDQIFLMTNGGLHHHLSNSGNFGQVIRKNYPVVLGNKVNTDENNYETVEIVGPLCTPLDIIGAKLTLPKAEIGDYVVVLQSGAYGATASPQNFLGHPQLKEILL